MSRRVAARRGDVFAGRAKRGRRYLKVKRVRQDTKNWPYPIAVCVEVTRGGTTPRGKRDGIRRSEPFDVHLTQDDDGVWRMPPWYEEVTQ